jgi:hypothetical protein
MCDEVTAPLAEAIADFEDIANILREVRRGYTSPRSMDERDRTNPLRLYMVENSCAIALRHVMNALEKLPNGPALVDQLVETGRYKR